MTCSQDQWDTSDKSKILSDDSSLESFDLNTSKRPSYYDPSEDCRPYLLDDPLCVPSKTPNPNNGGQPNQPISAYDQADNDAALINIQSDDDPHMNQSPPAYSPSSLDYRNHGHVPYAHNNPVAFPSAPASSYYGGPVGQNQYANNPYPNPQPYYMPQQSQAIQQPPQVVYVGVQPSMNPVNTDNSDLKCSLIGAIVLSVFALLISWIFGGFALSLAIRGYRSAKNGDRANAIKWRNISYALSIAGIIIGGAVTGIYIYIQSQRWKRSY